MAGKEVTDPLCLNQNSIFDGCPYLRGLVINDSCIGQIYHFFEHAHIYQGSAVYVIRTILEKLYHLI